jgi:hypothetical protein
MTYQTGDKVRVIADPSRGGHYVGHEGKVASNTLGGIVWIHLGLQYANFHEDGLEDAE